MTDERLYQLALRLVPNVGPQTAKNLVAYCGSACDVFRTSARVLAKVPGVGSKTAEAIKNPLLKEAAKKEVDFVDKEGLRIVFYADENYPHRLRQLPDSPLLFFTKGNVVLNGRRMLAIVGTRAATAYGRKIVDELIENLVGRDVTVVSGLAYGIDYFAHKACLRHDIPTIGVLGHGLDRIYPAAHRQTAEDMLKLGGLVSEFPSGTQPARENFPMRNRLVAGMCDATLVVEAANRGGALITANFANDYNRDVFAVPGRLTDTYSEGCNHLIRNHKSNLYTSIADLEYIMGWNPTVNDQEETHAPKAIQKQLFIDITDDEQPIVDLLMENEKLQLESICMRTKIPASKILTLLMGLELKGAVRALPGKVYAWV